MRRGAFDLCALLFSYQRILVYECATVNQLTKAFANLQAIFYALGRKMNTVVDDAYSVRTVGEARVLEANL